MDSAKLARVRKYIKQRKGEVARKYLSTRDEYTKHINLTEFLALRDFENHLES